MQILVVGAWLSNLNLVRVATIQVFKGFIQIYDWLLFNTALRIFVLLFVVMFALCYCHKNVRLFESRGAAFTMAENAEKLLL